MPRLASRVGGCAANCPCPTPAHFMSCLCWCREGGDAFLMSLGLSSAAPAAAAAWADPSADVLAVFNGMAAPAAGHAQLPLLPPMPGSFVFPLPPLPEAAVSDSLPTSGLFAAPPLPPLDPAAFLTRHTAGFQAAASLGGQQQLVVEESMAEAVSWPLPGAVSQAAAPYGAMAGTPGGARVASALTSHLSDVAGAACESEIHGALLFHPRCTRAGQPRALRAGRPQAPPCGTTLLIALLCAPPKSPSLDGRHRHVSRPPHGHCQAGSSPRSGPCPGPHPHRRRPQRAPAPAQQASRCMVQRKQGRVLAWNAGCM